VGRVEGPLLNQLFKLLDVDSSFPCDGRPVSEQGRRVGTGVTYRMEILANSFLSVRANLRVSPLISADGESVLVGTITMSRIRQSSRISDNPQPGINANTGHIWGFNRPIAGLIEVQPPVLRYLTIL
jgi:hypothetical protein